MRRKAFTLIEMLVVISILLIVATLTISMLNVSTKHDRIREGVRTVQSYFEGARDRAIFNRKPVGVRFLVDEDNPLTISGLVWVSATDHWTAGSIEIKREDNVDNVTGMAPPDGIPDPTGDATVIKHLDATGAPGTDTFLRLNQQGLLVDGMQIKINGNWYTVSTANLSATEPDRLDLIQPYTGSGLVAGSPALAATAYELTLAPTVLANQEPMRLPTGIVIDLLSSRIPNAFSPPVRANSTAYNPGDWVLPATFNGRAYQCVESTSNSGASEPTWPLALGGEVTDGGVTWRCTAPPLPEILFSPRGTVTGSMAAAGVIHMVLADRLDVDLGRRIGHPEKEGDELVATLFTVSGHIASHPVDTTGNADNIPDDPFFFAETGEVAK